MSECERCGGTKYIAGKGFAKMYPCPLCVVASKMTEEEKKLYLKKWGKIFDGALVGGLYEPDEATKMMMAILAENQIWAFMTPLEKLNYECSIEDEDESCDT